MMRRRVESAYHLGAHMGDEAPVLLLVCAPRQPRAGAASSFAARTAGASIYPAVQNLLLAARARGIGGCLTTIHLFREPQVKADHLLCLGQWARLGLHHEAGEIPPGRVLDYGHAGRIGG